MTAAQRDENILRHSELSGPLSEGFRNQHPELPWRQIRGMRNLFAHDYRNMDLSGIRETVNQDVPEIEQFCRKVIG